MGYDAGYFSYGVSEVGTIKQHLSCFNPRFSAN